MLGRPHIRLTKTRWWVFWPDIENWRYRVCLNSMLFWTFSRKPCRLHRLLFRRIQSFLKWDFFSLSSLSADNQQVQIKGCLSSFQVQAAFLWEQSLLKALEDKKASLSQLIANKTNLSAIENLADWYGWFVSQPSTCFSQHQPGTINLSLVE